MVIVLLNVGITYIRILVEDKEESRIHYYFPRVYGFIESAIFPKGKEEDKPKLQETECVKASNLKMDTNELTKETFTLGIISLMKSKGYFSKEKPPWSIEKEFEEEVKKYPKNNNRVLVHCAMGISRSSSIVIMYLMKRFNISFDAV